MAGHVFIVRGDLTRLACDAWLLPTDKQLTVTPDWLDNLPTVGTEDFALIDERRGGC